MPDDIRPAFDRGPEPVPVAIGEALRALPLETPMRSAWPALSTHLPAKARPRWPWALAASVLIAAALVAPHGGTPDGTGAGTGAAVATHAGSAITPAADPLHTLLAESSQLEALLASTADGAASAPALVLSADLEDRLTHIDERLSDATLADSQRLSLWQQRVDVLRELTGLQSTRQWLAASGETGYDGALVVAY